MRDFLLDNGFIILWVVCAAQLVLTGILFSDYGRKKDPIILCMAILGVGLCFDAVVLSMGRFILLPFLAVLSHARFAMHGLLIPMNMPVCAYAAPLYRRARTVVWVLAVIVMAAGGVAGVMRELDLTIIHEGQFNQIVRYVSVTPKNDWRELVNMALSYGMVAIIIITGIWVLIKQKTPTILLAGVLMLGFTALGPATGNADLLFLLSMVGEFCMMLFYLIYEKRHISKMYDFYH